MSDLPRDMKRIKGTIEKGDLVLTLPSKQEATVDWIDSPPSEKPPWPRSALPLKIGITYITTRKVDTLYLADVLLIRKVEPVLVESVRDMTDEELEKRREILSAPTTVQSKRAPRAKSLSKKGGRRKKRSNEDLSELIEKFKAGVPIPESSRLAIKNALEALEGGNEDG